MSDTEKMTAEEFAGLFPTGIPVYFMKMVFSPDSMTVGDIRAIARAMQPFAPRPISEAPKDRPILAYCDHEADPYVADETGHSLTLYAAHYEGMSHCGTGWQIVEWGGGFDDSSYEYPNQASLPDWWFVAGSEFEVAANPVMWMELPDVSSYKLESLK